MGLKDKMINDVYDILEKHIFQFNTEKVRNEMCINLSNYLSRDVIDCTSQELIDQGKYDFL